MEKQQQTFISFSDKWNHHQLLAFQETLTEGSDIFNWILGRNGFNQADDLRCYLSTKHRILDAGCGNGRVTALLAAHGSPDSEIVGVDITAVDIARENLSAYHNISIQEKDLLNDLSELGQFDFIYCQEVLHHTKDPKQAFLNLCRQLNNNGEIAIYVYKQKAPMREFADDMIRSRISTLPYEKAMAAMREITQLGKALTELKVKLQLPEIKLLDIPAGEYDIQRFLYHFFLKCFWNPALSAEENTAINYDWYHPQLCSRHTLSEVLQWFKAAKLTVVHQHVDFYGITIRGQNNDELDCRAPQKTRGSQ